MLIIVVMSQSVSSAAASGDRSPSRAGHSKLERFFFQYSGALLAVLSLFMLAYGYDKQWLHPTIWCLVWLGVALVGLFFHELRPFQLQEALLEERDAKKAE